MLSDSEKSIQQLNDLCAQSLVSHLQMEFFLDNSGMPALKMPVGSAQKQPFGQLHGGASLAMAETLAGAASMWLLDSNQVAMGVQVNANHVQWVDQGWVFAYAKAIVLKANWHLWDITIQDELDRIISVVRIQNRIVDKVSE